MNSTPEPSRKQLKHTALYGVPILCIFLLIPAIFSEWWNDEVAPWLWGLLGFWVVLIVCFKTWKRQQRLHEKAEE
ncbi:hypothetical protein Pla110_07710 [Polystyrenella longa]|uniref:Uncharacterized protein n=1 Tax=Polystyrenella longa TaxID=2528007 RepID=A0A518CIP9_9PLAN|nr:hypothetical protein [Polystyrenella longa]QDU79067.1 hypothetical protein Pla110_07710 [Polystyrenella longa]